MQKLTLVLIFAFSGALWAEPCAVTIPPRTDRLESIKFPDGRQIYMLGYIHGDRELPFKMADLIKVKAKTLSAEELHSTVAKLEDEASFALAEETTDVGQLRDLLAANSTLKFVGFETEDQFAVSNLENYQHMLADFQTMVRARIPTDLNAEQNLEHIVLGAAGTLRLSDPRLFASRQIRGFESANGTAASEKATLAADSAIDQLKELAKSDQEFVKNINGTVLELADIYPTYSVDQNPSLMGQMAKAEMPEKYRAATMEWFRLKLAEMAADKLREHDVVANILAANSSGILIMGSAHMDGIMSELRKQCLTQTTASR